MTNVWPAGLPQYVNQDSFKEQAIDNVIRTETDSGIVKQRRRFTAVAKKFTVAIQLTGAQKILLDEFFSDTCKDGAMPFEWVKPAEQTATNFQFMSSPSYSGVGPDTFVASFELQTIPT